MRVIWIRTRPDLWLFQLLNNLRVNEQRRFWIAYSEEDEDTYGIREDMGQISTGVETMLQVSYGFLKVD